MDYRGASLQFSDEKKPYLDKVLKPRENTDD
jgi:hypothetical protein